MPARLQHLAIDSDNAALAHELRQPLTALTLYLQSARGDVGSALPPRAMALLDKALREVDRAGLIIQRMRGAGLIGKGFRQLTGLNQLIDDALDLAVLRRRPPARVKRDFAKDLPMVLADPVQILQIVVNLLRNAFEAVSGEHDPEVRIRTCVAGGSVLLIVQDNGPGIPPRLMPELFTPFASSKPDGLGLGLVISRAIARRHGGDLTVGRAGEKGAAFTLHLPVSASPETASQDEAVNDGRIHPTRRNLHRRRRCLGS